MNKEELWFVWSFCLIAYFAIGRFISYTNDDTDFKELYIALWPCRLVIPITDYIKKSYYKHQQLKWRKIREAVYEEQKEKKYEK